MLDYKTYKSNRGNNIIFLLKKKYNLSQIKRPDENYIYNYYYN